jgi:hypothetical protein
LQPLREVCKELQVACDLGFDVVYRRRYNPYRIVMVFNTTARKEHVMTDAIAGLPQEFGRAARKAWNTLMAIVAAGGLLYGLWKLICFLLTASGTRYSGPDYLWFWGGVVLSIVWSVCSLRWSADTEPFREFWSYGGRYTSLDPLVLWLCSLALIPMATLMLVATTPHYLVTPHDYIRIMDDRRVLFSGMGVEAPRYQENGFLIPRSSSLNEYYGVAEVRIPTRSGTVTLRVRASFTLATTKEAEAYYASHRSEIRLDPEEYFTKLVIAHLSQVGVGLVEPLQNGRMNGDLVVPFTALLEKTPAPPWLERIQVRGVSVVSGEAAYK